MRLRHKVGVILLSPTLAACASSSASFDAPSSSESAEASASYEPDLPAIEANLEGMIGEEASRVFDRNIVGTSVDCPSEVEWHVGQSFRCDVKVRRDNPGYVEVTMLTSDGRYRWIISNQ